MSYHKTQQNYFLPRVKDGMTVTVKNVSFLKNKQIHKKSNSPKETEEEIVSKGQ
jgi:hypothetical protein